MGSEVQQCCCGCSLKCGAMAIGIVEAVLSAIGLLMLIPVLTTSAALTHTSMENAGITEEQIEEFMTAITALATIAAVMVFLQMVFAIIMACGASHEKPSLIQPWIIYSIVYLVLSTILNIIIASIAITHGQTGSGVQSLITFVFGSALKIYFYLVVKSYYYDLTRPDTMKDNLILSVEE